MKRAVICLVIAIPQLLLAGESTPSSSYVGQESRVIKSLSAEEIEALENGSGMGFAKTAELNHYPGPKHVLDLSEQLELTPSQESRTRALYEDMRKKAVLAGQELLQAEGALDLLFFDEGVSAASLAMSLNTIGQLRAQLRFIHLEAHLRQKNILDPNQVTKYELLRGYQNHTSKHDSQDHGGD